MSEVSRLPHIPAAELERMLFGQGRTVLRVEVRRPGDASWVNLSSVAGGDWVTSVQDDPGALGAGYQVDQPVGRFQIHLLAHADGRSTAPGIADEPLNRTASDTFAPLVYPGAFVRVYAGNAAGAGSPTMRLWLEGRVDDVEWPGDDVIAHVSTPDGELEERTWVRDEGEERGAEYPGVPLKDEIGALLQRYAPGVSLRVLPDADFPEYADLGVGPYATSRRALGPFLREWAQRMGADVRYLWSEADGAYRYTLYLPPRSRTTPHLSLGADQIDTVPALRVSREFVRNDFEIEYPDANTGKRETLTRYNTPSALQFGESYMFLGEGDESPVNTAAAAMRLLEYAEHDLADPPTTKRIRIPFCPWITLHDVIEVDADDVRFDYQTLWSVTAVRHHVVGEEGYTELDLRGGSPVGMFMGWHTRPRGRSDLVIEFGLVDFREIAPPSGNMANRAWGWTRPGRQVAGVWFGWRRYPLPWADDYWADVADRVMPLPDGQDYVEVPSELLPDASQVGALQVEPRIRRGRDLAVHSEEVIRRVKVEAVPADLSVDLRAEAEGPFVDLSLLTEQKAGAKVYPATAQFFEDGEAGALIATAELKADGVVTKAEVPALGSRPAPTSGSRTWAVVVTDVAGNVYRDKVEVSAQGQPRFSGVDTRLSPVNLRAVDLYGAILDPLRGVGGTLEWWFPRIDTAAGVVVPADPSGQPHGSRLVSSEEMADGVHNFDPTDPAAFSGIPTTGAETLTLFLRYTASDGRTTGAQPFAVKGSLGHLIDLTGKWRAGSIDTALALSEEFRWMAFASEADLAGTTPEDWKTNLAWDNAQKRAFRYNESTKQWDPTTVTMSHGIIPILQAGVVTTTVLAAEAVTATILAGNAVLARHLSSITMESGKWIRSTVYEEGETGWIINADGTAEFNEVTVRGTVYAQDGEFGGEVSAQYFTGSSAVFTMARHVHDIPRVTIRNGPPSRGGGEIMLHRALGASGLLLRNDGLQSFSGGIHLYDDTRVHGNLEVDGTITGTVPASQVSGRVSAASHATEASRLTEGSWETINVGGTSYTVWAR